MNLIEIVIVNKIKFTKYSIARWENSPYMNIYSKFVVGII